MDHEQQQRRIFTREFSLPKHVLALLEPGLYTYAPPLSTFHLRYSRATGQTRMPQSPQSTALLNATASSISFVQRAHTTSPVAVRFENPIRLLPRQCNGEKTAQGCMASSDPHPVIPNAVSCKCRVIKMTTVRTFGRRQRVQEVIYVPS